MEEFKFDKDKIWNKVISDERFPKKDTHSLGSSIDKRYNIFLWIFALCVTLLILFTFIRNMEKTDINHDYQISKKSEINNKTKTQAIATIFENNKFANNKDNSIREMNSSSLSKNKSNATESLTSITNKSESKKIFSFNQNNKINYPAHNLATEFSNQINPKEEVQSVDHSELTNSNTLSLGNQRERNINEKTANIHQAMQLAEFENSNDETTNSSTRYNDKKELENISKEERINIPNIQSSISPKREEQSILPLALIHQNLLVNAAKVKIPWSYNPPVKIRKKPYNYFIQGGLGRFNSTTKFDNISNDSIAISYFNKPLKSFHGQLGMVFYRKNIMVKLGLHLQVFEHNGTYSYNGIDYLKDPVDQKIKKYKIDSDYTLYQYYANLGALVQLGYKYNIGKWSLCPQLGIQLPLLDYSRGSLIQNNQLVSFDKNSLQIKNKISYLYGLHIAAPKLGFITPYLEVNGMSPITYNVLEYQYSQRIKSTQIIIGMEISL